MAANLQNDTYHLFRRRWWRISELLSRTIILKKARKVRKLQEKLSNNRTDRL
jgi:hypothetical protein